MVTEKQPDTYGFHLTTKVQFGTRYVRVTMLRRQHGAEHPLNMSCETESSLRAKDGLTIEGFVSEYSGSWVDGAVCYTGKYQIVQRDAEIMAATLAKINKALKKAEVTEPGDVLTVVAKIMGATWICETSDDSTSYQNCHWVWHSLGSGRERYRRAIAEAIADQHRFGKVRHPSAA